MQNALNRKPVFPHALIFFIVVFISVMSLTIPLYAITTTQTFSWSGVAIPGESLVPSGSAEFEYNDITRKLIIKLTNTSNPMPSFQWANGEVLTGLSWDIMPSLTLTPVSAAIAVGSSLISGTGNTSAPVWAFDPLLQNSGNSSPTGLGPFGIGTMGDVTGTDGAIVMGVFGTPEKFPGSHSDPIDGVDDGIVGLSGDFSKLKDPFVQNEMIFTFDVSAGVNAGQFQVKNVHALFGSVGKSVPAPIPEPSTVMLLGAGLISFAGYTRFRQRKSSSKS